MAFDNPGAGKSYATQFIAQKGDDVMFQVAGSTGNGVLQAACAANIIGIGVDVDEYLSLDAATTPAYGCILTSAEKHLSVVGRDRHPADRGRQRQGRQRPVQRGQRRHRRRAVHRQRDGPGGDPDRR